MRLNQVTITLPDAAAVTRGSVSAKKVDGSGHVVTVTGKNGATIDGAATFVLSAQYASATFYSDGTNWWVIR